ncbi:hypothetical protein KFK14_11315 [Sphingobium phenoxybenzoativorans]|uniref:Uncharacterized protein n=1 Tax=Sphingobium phenoxybenzoativorans TaxID=1592790 RepID=A0A975Q3X5_9SPHN|nr:hypothetical protein [Sphingobium phenoxybenzoativorans]QUT07918.1 hypothetical protein KFK14_11315 [Sphingobium phenoxybenzoativorans]
MTLRATLALKVDAQLASALDIGSAEYKIDELFRQVLSNGVGLNQANNCFTDNFAIVGAGNQSYDVAGGLTNALGQALTFTAIKAILVKNTGTAPLTIGAGSNPLAAFMGAGTHTIIIPPGGLILLIDPTAAGQAVVPSTGDVLRIAGTDAAGTIMIFGEA